MGAEIYLSKAKPDMKITVGMIARIFFKVVPSSFSGEKSPEALSSLSAISAYLFFIIANTIVNNRIQFAYRWSLFAIALTISQ